MVTRGDDPPSAARTSQRIGLSARHAILALLVAPDRKKDNGQWAWAAPIEGKTRLVKGLFLTMKETRSGEAGLFDFEFTPGPYGPSSLEVTDSLDTMIRTGTIFSEPFGSGRGMRLRLSPAGGKEALSVWSNLPQAARDDLYRTKSRIAQLSYRQFLVYVYRTYPEYTENSLIREEVLDEYAD